MIFGRICAIRADGAREHKHNICRNYGSMFEIHFSLSLCVYVESILRIHIYERIHLETTNKPPASYTIYPGAIVTGVSQVLIFVLCSFYLFFPFY